MGANAIDNSIIGRWQTSMGTGVVFEPNGTVDLVAFDGSLKPDVDSSFSGHTYRTNIGEGVQLLDIYVTGDTLALNPLRKAGALGGLTLFTGSLQNIAKDGTVKTIDEMVLVDEKNGKFYSLMPSEGSNAWYSGTVTKDEKGGLTLSEGNGSVEAISIDADTLAMPSMLLSRAK